MTDRILLLIIFSAIITPGSHAQNTRSLHRSEISPGPEYAVPTGGFRAGNGIFDAPGSRYKYGFGGSVKYIYHVNSTYGLSLQTGAIRYYADDKSFDLTSFPVKIGGNFRYRSIFAEPQLGLTYFTNNRTAYGNGSTTYGINIGAYVANHIVLSGNYERWNKGGFSASHVGIRLAYAFSFGEQKDSTRRERSLPSNDFNPNYQQSEYWKKHKTFKTLGWVSLGIGIPLTFAGLVAAVASIEIRVSTQIPIYG